MAQSPSGTTIDMSSRGGLQPDVAASEAAAFPGTAVFSRQLYV